MRSVRALVLILIVGMFIVGAVIDLRDRGLSSRATLSDVSLTDSTGSAVTWFCPGGSGPGGIADLTLELTSAAADTRHAVMTAALDPATAASFAAETAPPAAAAVAIPPGERVVLSPAAQAPQMQSSPAARVEWVGAVVELDSPDVVVEQVVADRQGGVGRSPCLTRTARRWIVSHGATRYEAEGERFLVMLLNPYPDFAVLDVEMVADVGLDSIEGLVVPAGTVVAVDVAEEIAAAGSVSVLIKSVSGRVAASWIQVFDKPEAGHGTRMAAAVAVPAPLWLIPAVAVGDGRFDTVAVSNPTRDRAAEVDIEVIADHPGYSVNPIELSVEPGRTVLVNLWEQSRLADLGGDLTLVVRSLEGVPVVASVASVVDADSVESAAEQDGDSKSIPGVEVQQDGTVLSGRNAQSHLPQVSGTTAYTAADAAARRWLLAVDPTASTGDAAISGGVLGFHDDTVNVVVVNPSETAIALVDFNIGGETVHSAELGPMRRRRIPLAWFGSGRFVLEVAASSPVIAAREAVGLTSRTASLGVAASESVLLTDLR